MTETNKCPICWSEMKKKIFDVGTEIDMLLKETWLYSIAIYWVECPKCKYKEIDYNKWWWIVIKKISELLWVDNLKQNVVDLKKEINNIYKEIDWVSKEVKALHIKLKKK